LPLLSSIACNAAGLRTDVRAAANYYKAIKNRQQDLKIVHYYYPALLAMLQDSGRM
jgi:hypothetical protein